LAPHFVYARRQTKDGRMLCSRSILMVWPFALVHNASRPHAAILSVRSRSTNVHVVVGLRVAATTTEQGWLTCGIASLGAAGVSHSIAIPEVAW